MMQNSPLLVTKINPTSKPRDIMANDKQSAEVNQTFKQMLSKQVDQSESKSSDDKQAKSKLDAKQQSKTKDYASAEVEQTQTAQWVAAPIDNVVSIEQVLASEIDAPQLASKVTAKTVKDVTDGAVDLEAAKQVQTAQTEVTNVTPPFTAAHNNTDNTLEATDKLMMSDSPAKTGFTNLPSLTQSPIAIDVSAKASSDLVNMAANSINHLSTINTNPTNDKTDAKVEVNANTIPQKPEAGLEVTALDKDKLANQLNVDKSTQFNQDSAITQPSNNIAEATSALGLAAQASGKQPSPIEATQTNLSNFINISLGKPGWSEAVGQKVAWMVGATEQSATLTLNPKDLGPLQIIINVNNEKADATFISDNPEVRKALEDGMSNLKQSMSQAGVELGQANINSGKEHQTFQQANQGYSQKQANVRGDAEATEHVAHQTIVKPKSNGLVDTFA